MYVIGKIVLNNRDGITYLYQNDDVDIYENYGDNDSIKLDYFLIRDAITTEDFDTEHLTEYTLCSKCGAIYETNNLNAVKCDCATEMNIQVYKIESGVGTLENRNNIYECPCCGHSRNSGIVRTLNIGKDEATALIAQALYQSIGVEENYKDRGGKKKLSFRNVSAIKSEEKLVKQFLSFSDSRQQASFFAVFFNANHTRFLQKRLLWDAIEKNKYEDLSVDFLAAFMERKISENELFDDGMNSQKQAWAAILTELMKVDGLYGGEGLGLFHFVLDLNTIMSQLSEEDIEDEFGQYDINKRDLEQIINIIFTTFKTSSAIRHTQSTLTTEEKKETLGYRRFDNYIMLRRNVRDKNISSFLPIKNSGMNANMNYIMKLCNCDADMAKNILESIFRVVGIEGQLFSKHAAKEAYQIDASKYILKNYKTTQYYRCPKCGIITPYNVHGICPTMDCTGNLVECDPDVVLKNNYYREQYKTKQIERIVVKEHTAQLDRKEAKLYQNEFKDKKINILSCSTTFEMGVDIGDLETVFLRNVPPTPANYVQRAGRAGRRLDSSAFVITYCGSSSHDYTFFETPNKMISGIIKPPFFEVTNEKIIIRHLMAAALGYFFKINPDYFASIDNLVCRGGIREFIKYLKTKPNELNDYINDSILAPDIREKYFNFKWFDHIESNDILGSFMTSIEDNIATYEIAMNKASQEENFGDAKYYKFQIDKIKKENVIDVLSKNSIIPKYGFPVDLVDLKVMEKGTINTKYDLSRDLKIAISEYAPDSEVIVDSKKLTSKYISLPKSNELTRYYFNKCGNCRKINISKTPYSFETCDYCGATFENKSDNKYFIIPSLGFRTGETKESTRMKPKRSYAGEVSYLGGGNRNEYVIEIENVLKAVSSTDDELLLMNKRPFYLCPVCGYSQIGSNFDSPELTKQHINYRGYECENKLLKKIYLGHIFKTDVARLTIPILKNESPEDYSIALSFLYALLEGISAEFNIERTDINGLVEQNENNISYDILIYDDVPGGAGYIKRIMNKNAIINSLKAAKEKVSQNCCDENTSCYNCLRNYYNQSKHPRLKRKYALMALDKLLNN